MTLFDFEELTEYWVEHPPVHILVGAYLGAGKQQRKRVGSAAANSKRQTGGDIQELLAELGPGFGAGDVHAGLPGVVLDFSELKRRAKEKV
jgi:hypothetical protein